MNYSISNLHGKYKSKLITAQQAAALVKMVIKYPMVAFIQSQ
jgi:hypothetical protein